jgi:hypothetical protein
MISSHERYRDALSGLAADDVVVPLVRTAGERFGWWTTERTWRRSYSRFQPDATPFATVVFVSEAPAQELCRIDVFETRPDDCGLVPGACDIDAGIGWARVMRFPSDPELPGLRPLAGNATVVRYHPGKRCTFRLIEGGRVVFAKVYATSTGARVYREMVALQNARSRGELQLAVAMPLSWEPESRTLRQAALDGQSAAQALCGPDGDRVARRIGMAAASLSSSAVAPQDVFDGASALARSRRRAAELARRVPDLSGEATAIVDRLAATHDRFPSHQPRPLHGAPHPDQWLDTGLEACLIDFDRFAYGDPEMDAGILLADLDALNGPDVAPERLSAGFLEGYRRAGIPLREPLIHAYRVHQQLAKALRAAQSIRPDGDRRAMAAAARAAESSRKGMLV